MRTTLFLLGMLGIALSRIGAGETICPAADALNRYVSAPIHKEMPTTKDGLVRIYYKLLAPFDAKKPTLLIIVGGPGEDHTSMEWLKKTDLVKQANVVGFDHRGLGCTSFLSPTSTYYEPELYAMHRAADDIEAIRNDLLGPDGRWFVYGVSYGTMLGQQYAIKYPDHILGLVLDSTFDDVGAIDVGRQKYLSLFITSDPVVKPLFDAVVKKFPDLRVELLQRLRAFTYNYAGRTQYLPLGLKQLASYTSEESARSFLDEWPDTPPPLGGILRRVFCEEIWDYPGPSEANDYYWWFFIQECPSIKRYWKPMHFSQSLTKFGMPTMI